MQPFPFFSVTGEMPILFFVNCERTVLFSVKCDLDPQFTTLCIVWGMAVTLFNIIIVAVVGYMDL